MRISRLAAVSMAAVLVASCGSSSDSDQVAELEDRVAELEDENAELRSQLEAASAEPELAEEPMEEAAEEPAEEPEEEPLEEPMEEMEEEPMEEPAEEPSGGDIDFAVDFGFTPNADRGVVSAGAVVTNNGGRTACGVQVQFSLLDSGGTPVDTVTESVALIRGGESVNVAPVQIGYEVADPADLTVTVVNVENTTDGTTLDDCDGFYMFDGIDVDVVNPTLMPGDFGSSIDGQLSNPSDTLVETSFINCVILAGGVIVGGESTASLDPIPPGGTVAFSMGFITYEGTADEVRCTAIG